MKITKVETIRTKEPIKLQEPWKPAWIHPYGKPMETFQFSFYKVYTDEGIIGIGPNTGYSGLSQLLGFNPFHVGEFWEKNMGGRIQGTSEKRGAGIEIALWDIIGKAAGLPIYKLLGARKDRVLVYAATSRLLTKEEHVDQVHQLMEIGFKAVKLRLHRPNPWDDLAIVEAVRKSAGDELMILVDANQNNKSEGYNFWSRGTSLTMAEELDKLKVYYLEEPLPRADIEGLAIIASTVNMFIAGGEHSPTIYDFKDHIVKGAYDIIQPDVVMMGNIGITGIKQVAAMADFYGKMVVPHVLSGAGFAMDLPATLHPMAAVDNCPLVEYGWDPPILTTETTQFFIKEPLLVEKDGRVKLPEKPGLGIELIEEMMVVV
ncbi:mandelate racemase/muconate lactonizing enzyme family protein [Candidatus Poribacteria bacterium]|nr:mandelate racemase/muconate lactonizing enzyme family protein [Candidatus Poribacteria bacterium]